MRDVPEPELSTTQRLALWFCAVGLVLRATAHLRAADLDMFHEMVLFREYLRSGVFPRGDVFAYTPTLERVVHHEWGTGAVLYLAAAVGGADMIGIVVFWHVVLGGIVLTAYLAARERGASLPVVVLLAGAAANLLAPGLAPVRAQMFTFLFTAALLLCLGYDRRGGRRWIPIWLAVFMAWLNLHGGFLVGAGLFGLYIVERLVARARESGLREGLAKNSHLLATLVAMALLTLVNPHGWHYLPYLWHALRMDRPRIDEWAPLWSAAADPMLKLAFILSLVVVAYGVVRGSRPPRLTDLGLLLAAGLHAAMHQRGVPVYGVVWFIVAAAYISRTPLAADLQRALRLAPRFVVVVALLVGAVGLRTAVANPWRGFVPATPSAEGIVFAVGAADYLAGQGFAGKLLTSFDDGAYISWRLHPAVRVSLDSRYEVAYPPELFELHEEFFAGAADWERLIERYPPDAILVRRGSPVATLLPLLRTAANEPEWLERYRDAAYSIFLRADSFAHLTTIDRSGQEEAGGFF